MFGSESITSVCTIFSDSNEPVFYSASTIVLLFHSNSDIISLRSFSLLKRPDVSLDFALYAMVSRAGTNEWKGPLDRGSKSIKPVSIAN